MKKLLIQFIIKFFLIMFVVSASVEAQNLPVDKSLVVEWLAHQAMPLRSVEPSDGGFEDLKPLQKTLKGVQIVGLGEATHGTREFFQFKHRLRRSSYSAHKTLSAPHFIF